MKFKLFRTALLLAAFCAASCNDSSYNLFPPEYETVLSIKDAGIKDCKYGSSITQVTDSLLILKGLKWKPPDDSGYCPRMRPARHLAMSPPKNS